MPLIQKEFDEERASRHCFLSEDGKFIYHVGIIDYLQDFNFDKMVENKYKSIVSDGQKISAVHPKMYCERFFEFMQSQVIINQDLVDVQRRDINLSKLMDSDRITRRYSEQQKKK